MVNIRRLGFGQFLVIAVFRFCQMVAVRHFGFVWGIFWLPLGGLYCCAKYGCDQCTECSSFDSMSFSISRVLAAKCLFMLPWLGCFGWFYP